MASKQMQFDSDARAHIAAGLSQLARAVKATLGPRGRNVVLQKSFGSPRITKDGVTVSKEIELPQPFENMGAKLINMVASKTDRKSTRLNSSHGYISYAVFCLKKKKQIQPSLYKLIQCD